MLSIFGKGYEFGDGKARRDYVAGWNGENQKVTWNVYLREDTVFDLSVEFERIGEPHDFIVTCWRSNLPLQNPGQGKRRMVLRLCYQ